MELGTTTHTDEQGSYIKYHKACHNCHVELTSRNRDPNRSLRCMPCQKEYRWTQSNPSQPLEARKSRPRKLTALHHAVSPERQRVHNLLTTFLCNPLYSYTKSNLLAALVDHELKARFSKL
jgi:hypothetical protein